MTTNPARSRTFGWLMAGVSSAAILSGAAALALAVESREEPAPMMLDLSMMPSTAPNVAAVAEEAPEVLDEVTQQSEPPEMEPPPELETEDTPPDLPMQNALSLPQIDKPVVADLSLPPPPEEPVVEPEPEKPVEKVQKAEKKPEKKPEPEPKKEKPKKKVETAEKVEKTEKPKEEASQAAAKAGAAGAKAGKAKGGSKVSPEAYRSSVYKKINKKKKRVNAKGGTAVVSFTIGASGSLAGLKLSQSSGNAALDKAALDSVSRAAPFGVPPEGKAVTFGIQFDGK